MSGLGRVAGRVTGGLDGWLAGRIQAVEVAGLVAAAVANRVTGDVAGTDRVVAGRVAGAVVAANRVVAGLLVRADVGAGIGQGLEVAGVVIGPVAGRGDAGLVAGGPWPMAAWIPGAVAGTVLGVPTGRDVARTAGSKCGMAPASRPRAASIAMAEKNLPASLINWCAGITPQFRPRSGTPEKGQRRGAFCEVVLAWLLRIPRAASSKYD